MARVSVIVVNYNRWDLLCACLNGLAAQTCNDLEVIVVDNGSTDGSPVQVARAFPRVRLIALERNTGFCEANNRGIAATRSEFIALLNNDAVPEPRWLEELIRAADAHPECGFFASRVLCQDNPALLDSAGDGIAITGAAYRRGHLQPSTRFTRPEYVFGASGSAAFYRRSMLQEIGSFDEDFFAVYEDADLSCRAQLAGYKCWYVPTAIVHHRGSSTIGRYTDLYVYQTQRNVEFFFLKNMPAPLVYVLFLNHLIYNFLGLFYFGLIHRRGGTFLRAKVDAIQCLSRMREKRRLIQSKRRISISYFMSLLQGDWIRRTLAEKFR